jgi:hypothetical protein
MPSVRSPDDDVMFVLFANSVMADACDILQSIIIHGLHVLLVRGHVSCQPRVRSSHRWTPHLDGSRKKFCLPLIEN